MNFAPALSTFVKTCCAQPSRRLRKVIGQRPIHWYLLRYHGIKVSSGAVYYVLKRNGLNRLPRNARKHRAQLWQRYEKQVPGHHVADAATQREGGAVAPHGQGGVLPVVE